MQKHRIRFTSEDDVRSQKSHYTNVSKINSIPSKNVELSLEVELDDEVRSLIKHPEKCPSALLDVTVIKPTGLDQYTTKTQTLKTEQVKRLIECMTLDSTDKRKLMERLFGMRDIAESDNKSQETSNFSTKEQKRKSCLSSKCKPTYHQSSVRLEHGDVHCITDETNSAVFSMHKQKSPEKEDTNPGVHQQIYTSPRTYENIRTMFSCKNNKEQEERENDKTDQPCLCQNCAIVGILADSQKKPFATEPVPNPMEDQDSRYRRPSRKKSVSFKHFEDLPSSSRSHDQCQAIFKLLSSRITELEKRIIMQEQKAVPKDYFKKIITKLVNHVSKLTHYTTEERNLSTSYRQKDAASNKYKSNDKYNNRYYVNSAFLNGSFKVPAEKEYDPKPCSSSEPPRGPSESIWKWGEEFLTTGRDLKNKVVVLLEETLYNLRKGWEKPQNNRNCDEDLQSVVDELSKNLAKTVRIRESSRTKEPHVIPLRLGKPRKSNVSVSLGSANQRAAGFEKKSGKPSLIPRFKRKPGPAVNVAYINPQLTRWPEESSVSFKIDTSDYESHKDNMSEAKRNQYKKEFLKILENTKTTDKFKLWQNIWNQALENRQTKNDTVMIQIPDPKDLLHHKMIHLEYTIGELERLLLKSQDQPDARK